MPFIRGSIADRPLLPAAVPESNQRLELVAAPLNGTFAGSQRLQTVAAASLIVRKHPWHTWRLCFWRINIGSNVRPNRPPKDTSNQKGVFYMPARTRIASSCRSIPSGQSVKNEFGQQVLTTRPNIRYSGEGGAFKRQTVRPPITVHRCWHK